MDSKEKKHINNRGVEVNENNIINHLKTYYPNKLINNISDIYRKKRKVYLYINKYCKEHNITNTQYLQQKGFKILSNEVFKNDSGELLSASLVVAKPLIHNKYNVKIIKSLVEDYNCTKSEIAICLGIRRQLVDQQLTKKVFKDNFIGDVGYFEEEVEEKVISIIKALKVEYKSSSLEIKIYFSSKDTKVAILYKYNENIKCIFNPKGSVGDTLKENRYGIYNTHDLELLKDIREGKCIKYIKKWDGDNSKFIIIDNNIRSKLLKNAKRRTMKLESYIEFLDLSLYSLADEIEDRLYGVFKNNLTQDGIVKIENKLENGKTNPGYINIYRDLKKLNISLRELAEKFGFQYKRIINKQSKE